MFSLMSRVRLNMCFRDGSGIMCRRMARLVVLISGTRVTQIMTLLVSS